MPNEPVYPPLTQINTLMIVQPDMTLAAFCTEFKARMQVARVTKYRLAKTMGVEPCTVSRWLNGNIDMRFTTLARLEAGLRRAARAVLKQEVESADALEDALDRENNLLAPYRATGTVSGRATIRVGNPEIVRGVNYDLRSADKPEPEDNENE